jgi:hypothetical protein
VKVRDAATLEMEGDRTLEDIGPAYRLLMFGLFLLLLAVVATCTGESWGRFGRVIYRDKDSKKFWWDVAISYLGGVCVIAYFLFKAYVVGSR